MLWIVCVAGLGMRVAGLWEHFPFILAVCVRRRPGVPLIPHCTKVSPPALSREQVMINRSSIIEVKDFLHPLLMGLKMRVIAEGPSQKGALLKKSPPCCFRLISLSQTLAQGFPNVFCEIWEASYWWMARKPVGTATRVSRGWMIYSKWLWCITEWLFVI